MRKFLVLGILCILPSLVLASSPDRYSNIKSGNSQVTTPGTAVQLSTTSIPCKELYITSYHKVSHDTGCVYIGGSDVSAGGAYGDKATKKGIAVMSDDALYLPAANLNVVYVDSQHTADGVSFVYLY